MTMTSGGSSNVTATTPKCEVTQDKTLPTKPPRYEVTQHQTLPTKPPRYEMQLMTKLQFRSTRSLSLSGRHFYCSQSAERVLRNITGRPTKTRTERDRQQTRRQTDIARYTHRPSAAQLLRPLLQLLLRLYCYCCYSQPLQRCHSCC